MTNAGAAARPERAVSPAEILPVVLLVALVVYAVTGGAEYGGGVWDLLAPSPRARARRDVIAHAIGSIWEANHVWLIFLVTVLFTAFPSGFGAVATALHVPLTLVLVSVVLRGTSSVSFSACRAGSRRRAGGA